MSDSNAPIKGEFICVVCPTGCSIEAEFVRGARRELIDAKGYRCPRGEKWIKQEIEEPMRTIATSVMVRDGDYINASVRTKDPIPLEKVPAVVESLRGIVLDAPVRIGQVVLHNPSGAETDIVATRNVERCA